MDNNDSGIESPPYELRESKWFIEWIAADMDERGTPELARLQIQLAVWPMQSDKSSNDAYWRSELATQ